MQDLHDEVEAFFRGGFLTLEFLGQVHPLRDVFDPDKHMGDFLPLRMRSKFRAKCFVRSVAPPVDRNRAAICFAGLIDLIRRSINLGSKRILR